MAEQLQLRRGTEIENDAFTGAQGELTYDTTKGTVRVHNGTTQGGSMIDPVVAFQAPTAANNYIWYRLYASGWVEQGCTHIQDAAIFTFPIEMADTNYSIMAVSMVGSGETKATSVRQDQKTTTGCVVYFTTAGYLGYVEVKGMAA